MNEYLTTREFDLFRADDAKWKERLDERLDKHMELMTSTNTSQAAHATRLTLLESYSDRNKSHTAKVSAGISLLVNAIVAGLALFNGK